MDRRSFLTTGATVALLPLTEAPVFAQARGSGDARLNALFEEIFQEAVQTSPTLATQLGLDKGAEAALKPELRPTRSQFSAATTWRATGERSRNCRRSARHAVRRRPSSTARWSLYQLETADRRRRRGSDIDSAQRPYPIIQQDGAYFSVPDFLNSAHTIDNTADAEAYLSRLEPFAAVLDNEHRRCSATEAARGYPRAGLVARPDARARCASCAGRRPSRARMVESLVRRTAEKDIAGDWQRRATQIVEERSLSRARPPDRADASSCGRRAGPATACGGCRTATRSTRRALRAGDHHQFLARRGPPASGSPQVAEISAPLDTILREAGL